MLSSLTMFGQIITGTAKDAKAGAVVVTTDNAVYYLDRLEAWSSDVVGKQVRVTGKVVVKKPEKRKENEIRAEITTPINLIRRYKVERVD
jgi:RNase P/RNase MRP subunit p29